MAPQTTTTATASARTRHLLTAGIVAGPLFLVVWFVQAVARDGFDPGRHPISLLALGGAGWVQIANFVLTGSLFIASAVGMRRATGASGGGRWVPRLVTTFGLGLVIAGIFVTDAGAGFPAGAPAGKPDMTWHGAIHEFGHVLNVVSFLALCGVMIRRFAVRRNHAAAVATLVTLLAALVVGAFPGRDTFSVRIVVATAVEFAFVAAIAGLTPFRQALSGSVVIRQVAPRPPKTFSAPARASARRRLPEEESCRSSAAPS